MNSRPLVQATPTPVSPVRRRTRGSLVRGATVVAVALLAGCVPGRLLGNSAPQAATPPGTEERSDLSDPPPVATPVQDPARPGMMKYQAKSPAQPADYLELPLQLVIPRLGVDAPVIAVGQTPEGAMDVPQQAHQVGWYLHSQRPGLTGNAVFAGHLDWYGVDGVFRRLAELGEGDKIVLRAADGQERAYTVEWRRDYPATSEFVADVFGPLPRQAVTLITCGGRWNPATQRYDRRVVVRARR